jgi:hypothetical protein
LLYALLTSLGSTDMLGDQNILCDRVRLKSIVLLFIVVLHLFDEHNTLRLAFECEKYFHSDPGLGLHFLSTKIASPYLTLFTPSPFCTYGTKDRGRCPSRCLRTRRRSSPVLCHSLEHARRQRRRSSGYIFSLPLNPFHSSRPSLPSSRA